MSFCHEFSVCLIQFLSWISCLKNTFSQIDWILELFHLSNRGVLRFYRLACFLEFPKSSKNLLTSCHIMKKYSINHCITWHFRRAQAKPIDFSLTRPIYSFGRCRLAYSSKSSDIISLSMIIPKNAFDVTKVTFARCHRPSRTTSTHHVMTKNVTLHLLRLRPHNQMNHIVHYSHSSNSV